MAAPHPARSCHPDWRTSIESHLRPAEEDTGEGLLAFYHDQLRFAACRRCLKMQSPEEQATDAFREAHGELAQYFRKVVIDEDGEFPKWRWDQKRSLRELPHHQLSAGMSDALEKVLTDIGFVEAKSRTGLVSDLVRDYAVAEQSCPRAGVAGPRPHKPGDRTAAVPDAGPPRAKPANELTTYFGADV